MKCLTLVILLTVLNLSGAGVLFAADRPNIVWLTSEDNSKHWLRLYNESGGAAMPNLERLASQSLVFENAFSNAPVCSVARSTLITGCYAPRIGAQFHRRAELAPMPEGLHMYPRYLKQAGYYTTNNVKKDYNLVEDAEWDESSRQATYRDRADGQPFFHIQNYTTTHESSLHFSKREMAAVQTTTNPRTVQIFPYHPATQTFRYTYARYLDQHRKLDAQLGTFLRQLEEDGLMEDTIIFYFGDHGGALPGSKGYAYERGLSVPLVIYVPEKWRHLVPVNAVGRTDAFVSFVDFAPTLLNLADVKVPEQMDGTPFLGRDVSKSELQSRDESFGYADRFDEKYDLVRTFRKGRYKYIRNYQPFNFDALQNNYRYRMLAYQEWRDLHEAGELSSAQDAFFQPRPPEMLFDIENDPHEIENLAQNPDYQNVLEDLRQALTKKIKKLPDLSFYPESVIVSQALDNPVAFGQRHRKQIGQLIDIADLQLRPFKKARKRIRSALESGHPWERYWGLIVCGAFGKEAARFEETAKVLAQTDPEPLVRSRAAEFLGLAELANPERYLVNALRSTRSEVEAHLILNTITLLRDSKFEYEIEVNPLWLPDEWRKDKKGNVARRLEYLK